jgi:putative transposase
MITYKYRLYPTREQQDLLWLHANKLNNLYNNLLAEKIDAFQKDGTNIAKSEQNKKLPKLRKNDPILAQIHSQVLQQVTLRLDKAYQDFFRRVKNGGEAPGFPKFRSCNIFFAITYPQNGYQIVDSVFTTNAYGKIKFNKHKEIQGKIKQITITCKNNKFYLCIVTNFEKDKKITKNTSIGIDLGLKDLVVASDSLKIKNQQDSKYFDKK